jgi:hypothetical protein
MAVRSELQNFLRCVLCSKPEWLPPKLLSELLPEW